MAIGPRLDLRQSQSLVMTPQLRQAIKLLQLTNLEVTAFVEEELERNPLLERAADDSPPLERPAPDQLTNTTPADTADAARADTLPAEGPLDADFAERYDAGGPADGAASFGRGGTLSFEDDEAGIESIPERTRPLHDYLGEQLRLTFPEPIDRLIGAHLIALLCPAGRLTAEPAVIAAALNIPLNRLEAVRQRMMRFDPVGLFARDLKECLAVQLAERNRLDPAMEALLDNLDLLARRDLRRLLVLCEVDLEDLTAMIAELRELNPKPGWSGDGTPLQTVIPDLLMRQASDGSWLLELNPQTLPRVLINQHFYARVAPRVSRDERGFLAEKLAAANWLIKSLQQRSQTILRVAAEIVRQQDGFLRYGISHLRPLILRDIAAAVDMHESTVSRVTAGKYIATPRGTFELKYFFTTAIPSIGGGAHSAETIRHRIREMIGAETPEDILSDDAIVAALRKEGVDIARRTVAKYREALHIPSSVQRKREKAVPA
ncbi:MAG: RNA polymerase factor sigma-54 [Acetobacteraceae bacterium]|nr:RNA polymerase factor sigma-54 [Acetobacteraceae bacterium]